MALTPGEQDRLLLHLQALLATSRRERGLLLNVPEATALIADAICEWAREGLDLPTVRERAGALLARRDVLPGVPEAINEVRVEARFDDGTRLVVVPDPFSEGRPSVGAEGESSQDPDATAVAEIRITNEARTAIGLTSHVHLAEVNPRLRLDRAAAFGMRAAIPTGDTVWVHPGESVTMGVRPIEGGRLQWGTSGAVDGDLDDPEVRARALALLRECGYLDIHDGRPAGDPARADDAVGKLMRRRHETSEEKS